MTLQTTAYAFCFSCICYAICKYFHWICLYREDHGKSAFFFDRFLAALYILFGVCSLPAFIVFYLPTRYSLNRLHKREDVLMRSMKTLIWIHAMPKDEQESFKTLKASAEDTLRKYGYKPEDYFR